MNGASLLERDDLLAILDGHLSNARLGSGSMALVAGEAGAGKTSLARALRNRVESGVLVLQGHCDPLVTPRPMSPLYDIAADAESGIGDLFAEARTNIEIFDLVLERLRETIRPVLMIIEDIHWADVATLDFLRFVGRRVENTKALVVCTYRDDEVGPDHPLRVVLGQLGPLASTHRLAIPPLTETAVASLIADRPMDAMSIHKLTGGNAFYVTEIIAAATGELPVTIKDAVLARVTRLGTIPRLVVESVSIAPRSLEIDRAGVLADAESARIDEAVASGVLVADGDTLRFRHELARAAVEESLAPARRLELHRRMLALLEEEDPVDLARLAHHAVRAGSGDSVVEYAPAAAEEASKRGSAKEAVALYQAALEHAGRLDGNREADLRISLSIELAAVDDPAGALAQAEQAADYYRRTGQAAQLANALNRVGTARWRLNDIPGAREATAEAVALLEPLGTSRDLAYTYYLTSHQHMLSRHFDRAMAAIAKARSVAEESGSADVLWMADMMLGTIEIVLGDARRGADLLRDAAGQAKTERNAKSVGVALSMLGSGGGEARLYSDSIAALDEGISLGLAHDQDYSVAYMRSWHARIAFEQGRWDEATTYAELVDRTTPDREGIAMVTARGALGRVRVRRGDPGGRQVLEPIVTRQGDYEIQHVWSPISGLAEHYWLTGQPERMSDGLADGYHRALDTDSPWARGELGFWMWKAGAINEPPDRAAEPFALHMSGKWREAAAAWREIGCPYEVGLALSDGDENALLEAVSIFDSLGARPAAGKARARLRDMGIDRIPRGPSAETRANPGGLTARQLEVLELMKSGLTNAEIADRLFVSKKTVEHHVSAIFDKLGVTTRAKAIAAAVSIRSGPR